jgi:hypothetical protein
MSYQPSQPIAVADAVGVAIEVQADVVSAIRFAPNWKPRPVKQARWG